MLLHGGHSAGFLSATLRTQVSGKPPGNKGEKAEEGSKAHTQERKPEHSAAAFPAAQDLLPHLLASVLGQVIQCSGWRRSRCQTWEA